MKVLSGGSWKDATPKGVIQGGVWKTPVKISVLKDGAWVKAWPADVAAPEYLYGVDVEYLPNYEVKFTLLDGWPAGNAEEAYFFRCTQMPRDGYTGRTFNKTFAANAYSGLDCILEDRSNIPGKEMKTINFKIYPRA